MEHILLLFVTQDADVVVVILPKRGNGTVQLCSRGAVALTHGAMKACHQIELRSRPLIVSHGQQRLGRGMNDLRAFACEESTTCHRKLQAARFYGAASLVNPETMTRQARRVRLCPCRHIANSRKADIVAFDWLICTLYGRYPAISRPTFSKKLVSSFWVAPLYVI